VGQGATGVRVLRSLAPSPGLPDHKDLDFRSWIRGDGQGPVDRAEASCRPCPAAHSHPLLWGSFRLGACDWYLRNLVSRSQVCTGLPSPLSPLVSLCMRWDGRNLGSVEEGRTAGSVPEEGAAEKGSKSSGHFLPVQRNQNVWQGRS
jgi:hypothetical protein